MLTLDQLDVYFFMDGYQLMDFHFQYIFQVIFMHMKFWEPLIWIQRRVYI